MKYPKAERKEDLSKCKKYGFDGDTVPDGWIQHYDILYDSGGYVKKWIFCKGKKQLKIVESFDTIHGSYVDYYWAE